MNASYWKIQYTRNYCTRSFHFSQECTKIVSGWGSAPDPAGGAYSAPPDPLAVMGWDGDLVTTFLGWKLCAPLLVAGAPLLFWGWLRAWMPLNTRLFILMLHSLFGIECDGRKGYIIKICIACRLLICACEDSACHPLNAWFETIVFFEYNNDVIFWNFDVSAMHHNLTWIYSNSEFELESSVKKIKAFRWIRGNIIWFDFIPEQFTVKAHPALFEGEGEG